jgi:hypothetical protein
MVLTARLVLWVRLVRRVIRVLTVPTVLMARWVRRVLTV